MLNPFESFYIVLRDEYTEKELEAAKFVFENCTQFYVLDERSDLTRAMMPLEKAAVALKERLLGGQRKVDIPKKIEIKEDK